MTDQAEHAVATGHGSRTTIAASADAAGHTVAAAHTNAAAGADAAAGGGTTTVAAAPATALPSPSLSLWRNRRLQTLNLGTFAANTGVAVADVVFPLLVLGFTGKPILAGLFGAVQFTAMVLASLPAGAIIDRHDRRRILIAGELVRALVATTLAITLAAGHIWLAEIYLVAAVLGACHPFTGVRTLIVRNVVPTERLTGALAAQQIAVGTASLLGPALGAMMFTLSRSLAFTVVAAGMGLSAACAYLVRYNSRLGAEFAAAGPAAAAAAAAADADADADAESPAATADTAHAEVEVEVEAEAEIEVEAEVEDSGSPLVGLRIIWRSAVMRSTMLFIMMMNLIGVPLDLVIIVEARHQGISTRYLGAILATFALGGIIGAPLVPKVHALLRPSQVLGGFGLLAATVMALLAVPFGAFWMAGCMLAVGLILPAVEILINVLILQQVPDHQRGRVMSAMMTFVGLGMPLGAAFGGTLLQLLSPATVLIGAGAVLACVTLVVLTQRDLRAAQWPSAE